MIDVFFGVAGALGSLVAVIGYPWVVAAVSGLGIKQEKAALAQPKSSVDQTSLIADLSNLGQQVQMIVAKYQATPTEATSTVTVPPAAPVASSST